MRRGLDLFAICGNNMIAGGERECGAGTRPAESVRNHTLEHRSIVRHAGGARMRSAGRIVPHLLAADFRFHLQARLLRARRTGFDPRLLSHGH